MQPPSGIYSVVCIPSSVRIKSKRSTREDWTKINERKKCLDTSNSKTIIHMSHCEVFLTEYRLIEWIGSSLRNQFTALSILAVCG